MFEGASNVATMGQRVYHIPVDSVRALLTYAKEIGFRDSPAELRMGSPGCRNYAADGPTVVLSFVLDGKPYRVVHDHGCLEAPAFLVELEQKVDAVARTRSLL